MAKARRQKKMKSLSEQTSEEADERRRKATESVARREKKKEPGTITDEYEGHRVVLDEDNNELRIIIDLSWPGHPSKSGKMMLLASSAGWKKIGDVSFSFNVGRKV